MKNGHFTLQETHLSHLSEVYIECDMLKKRAPVLSRRPKFLHHKVL